MSVKSIIARYEADLLEVNPQIIKTNACYNEAQDQRAPDKELRALDNVVWPLLEQRSALDKQKKDAIEGELKGNPILLMPISDIEQAIPSLTPSQQKALNSTVNSLLGRGLMFVGELVFQNDKTLSKSNEKGKEGISVMDEEGLNIIRSLLERQNLAIGCLYEYHDDEKRPEQAEISRIKQTPLDSAPGTARSDKVKDYLEQRFKINETREPLTFLKSSPYDGRGILSIKFNLSAELKSLIQEAELGETEIANAIDEPAKRVLRRNFLRYWKSATPTNSDKAKELDADKKTTISIQDNTLNIELPLSPTIKGEFLVNNITIASGNKETDIEADLALRIEDAIRIAAALKNVPTANIG